MSKISLLVGLGNPGRKYKKTRHNIGFRIIDEFQKENNFPKFKFVQKFKAEISEGIINDNKIILAKPQTFMNNSGAAIKLILNFYKIPPSQLTVAHDELDLPIGETKVSQNSGSAGHNGIKSIIQELGTQDFTRVRIGINPNKIGDTNKRTADSKNFVLEKFSKDEEHFLKQSAKQVVRSLVRI